ncbi:MAG: ABC transporter ATP-binding protein [Pseudomonadota bacterium]
MAEGSNRILAVENLSKRFGGFAALYDVGFKLNKGEILGLVGPNGAGKTTTFNIISGFLRPTTGRVFFQGQDITNISPYDIARIGLVRTFQLNKIFSSLTVEENIRIGCHLHRKGGPRRFVFGTPKNEKDELEARKKSIFESVGLDELKGKLAEDLPYGDQKMLGIGISMATDPTLLLLDEPFAGMNIVEANRCVSILRRIVQKGTTVFLVDHNMRAVMGFCDRIIVLNFGRKIADGTPDEIKENPEVINSYLGGVEGADS